MKKITNVIEAISKHEDEREALRILEELGTNSPSDDIREVVSRFLVRKNTTDFLKLAIVNKGKGINDMSARVAMSTINELLTLQDKTEAMRILDETINEHSEQEVQDTARSVKALMCFGA